MRARDEMVVALKDIAGRAERVVGRRPTMEKLPCGQEMMNELNYKMEYGGV